MKKISFFIIAFFYICLFQIFGISAQDMFDLNNRKASNTFIEFHPGKKFIFEQPNVLIKTNNQSSILTNSLMVLQPVVPDFQVNENAGPIGAEQSYSVIASDDSGNFVIVWEDNRNGDWDIYAQRFTKYGVPIGANFKVNDDPGCAEQKTPRIAIDGCGNFTITWVDKRNKGSYWELYAQRYQNDGTPLGNNFKVNENNNVDQYSHHINYDSNGNIIINWSKSSRVYCQIYSSEGLPETSNYILQEGVISPSLAVDASGNFIVTWLVGYFNVYAKRIARDGTPLSDPFKVNEDQINANEMWSPKVVVNDSGNFVIRWLGGVPLSIYCQFFSSDGKPIGGNKKIVEDDSSFDYFATSHIFAEQNGDLLILWNNYVNEQRKCFAQRCSGTGEILGNNFQFFPNKENVVQSLMNATATDKHGNYFMTWGDKYNAANRDIYAQCYLKSENSEIISLDVNDDYGSANQSSSEISVDNKGNFVITWIDYRNSLKISDIYAQIYTKSGEAIMNNFPVNSGDHVLSQESPAISTDIYGNFIITWVANKGTNTSQGIFAKRFTKDGIPLGDVFQVSELNCGIAPSITNDNSGNYVITWVGPHIQAQILSSDGTLVGQNFRVDDSAERMSQTNPSISMDGQGNFIIAWEDDRLEGFGHDKSIYARRIFKDGKINGNDFFVDYGEKPGIIYDSMGNFIIIWLYGNNVWGRRFLYDRTPYGEVFSINEAVGKVWHGCTPSIARDENGNFVVVWTEGGMYNLNVVGQRFLADTTPLGNNFLITDSLRNQHSPGVKLNDNKIYTTWTDNKAGGTGYDIWANVMLFNSPPQWISSNIATAYEDSCFEYHASAIDPEGFTIRYIFQSFPGWCLVSDSVIYGIPPEGAKDTSLVVIASDGQISDTLEVVITVIPINDPPQIINLSEFHLKNNEPYIINLDTCVCDVDNLPEDLTWKVHPLDNRLRVDVVNHVAIFSSPNWTGETEVLFKVTDPAGTSDSNMVEVSVITPSSARERDQLIPEKFCLEQNYPNPFNPLTNIIFGLPKPSAVTIHIFNLTGEFVTTILNGRKEAGYHTVVWDAFSFPSGTYFIKMQAGDFVQTRKCVLLK